jgi:hypothetical protein
MTSMIEILRRPESRAPPIIEYSAGVAPQGQFRLAVRDPAPFFQYQPLFADRADSEWFFLRAWQHIPPMVGVRRGESRICCEFDKFVVLHRYGEGVIFDTDGAANSPGFLNNMKSLPAGMTKLGESFVVDKDVLRQAQFLPGTWSIFYNGNLQNYYHWLIEGMLALHLIDGDLSLSDRTVLPAELPPNAGFSHIGMVRHLGHDKLLIERTAVPYVRCEAVVYVERGEIENYPACELRRFQRAVSERYADRSCNQRILISRRRLRTISNQDEIENILRPLGFRSYVLEDMTVEAQIRLFSSASFVVSPHGAGLSNLVYAPQSCKVLELMPECEMRPFFWHIGAKLGHAYGMMPCPTHDNGFNGHLIVDQKKFQVLFSMVEAQR